MASVTRLLFCRVGAISLALQQPRYFCFSLVGSRSSRLVKPVGHRFFLRKTKLLAVPPLKTWVGFVVVRQPFGRLLGASLFPPAATVP